MPVPPQLSVVIISWNTCDLLRACLTSLLDDRGDIDGLSAEVMVVDNASSDGTCQMLRDQFPNVRLLRNDQNVGFARANNQGIAASSGTFVCLLNPDTEVRTPALGVLVRFLEEHPRAGAIGPRLINPDGSLQPSCFPAPTLTRELWRLLHLDVVVPYGTHRMASWRFDRARSVDVVQGTCLVLPRTVLARVGGLDEDYFIYAEEVDLCHRLRDLDWEIYWVPDAVVMHHGGQSTRQVAAAMFLRLYQAKVLYFRKRRGHLSAQAYKLILVLVAVTRLTLTPLVWLTDAPRRDRYLALAGHYARLLKALPCF